MPTIQMLKEAESIGLTGDSIAKYCLEQQSIARDERACERAEKAKEREHIARMKELESEEADKVRAEAERVRAHELAMAQHNNPNNISNVSNVSYTADAPVVMSEAAKLPIFK